MLRLTTPTDMRSSFVHQPLFLILAAATLWSACAPSERVESAGAGESAEAGGEWTYLFDGASPTGWRGTYSDSFPSEGWLIEDSALVSLGKRAEGGGGDIITLDQYDHFELAFEFSIDPEANSGVKYFVLEHEPPTPGRGLGLEYQIWDDDKPREDHRRNAALFDLIPAEGKSVRPPGTYNAARILARGDHVEHWLNGVKVLEYERSSPPFRERVAGSKYSDIEGFGLWPRGHILLQDEGGPRVRFRRIRIRSLALPEES